MELFLRSHESILCRRTGESRLIVLFILYLYTKWVESVNSKTLHFTLYLLYLPELPILIEQMAA